MRIPMLGKMTAKTLCVERGLHRQIRPIRRQVAPEEMRQAACRSTPTSCQGRHPEEVQTTRQYVILNPNWMLRGPLALVTAPKPQANGPGQPGDPAGWNGVPKGAANPPGGW